MMKWNQFLFLGLYYLRKKIMRIGFDAKRAYNNVTGLGNYSRYVLNGLAERYPKDELFAFTPKVNDELRKLLSNKLILQTPKNSFAKTFHSYWRTYSIKSLIEKESIDVYHGLSNELPANINKAAVKSVVTIHDLIFKRYPDYYKAVDRKIYDQKFQHACKVADRIVAISEQTKKDIIEFYQTPEQKIEVIYQDCAKLFHGDVTPEMKQHVTEKYQLPQAYILCVGTIEQRKNQLTLVKAFKEIDTDVKLVLLGNGKEYLQKVNHFIEANKLADQVMLISNVASKDMPLIYSQASLFVYPSLFEGFGIPIIEAQNMGVPVITSKGGCFAETGGDAAMYIDPNNVVELQEAMESLLQDEKKRLEMSAKGKINVMKFRSERTIVQLHELYEKLL